MFFGRVFAQVMGLFVVVGLSHAVPCHPIQSHDLRDYCGSTSERETVVNALP